MKRRNLALTLLCTLVSTLPLEAGEPNKNRPFHSVNCEGTYRHHLQGVCTNEKDALFWCFTTTLVKTDTSGKILKKIPVGNHHGDLCHHDNKIYVAVNFGRFNDAQGNADSWVYVYDAHDLALLAKHKTMEVFHGAGGVAYHDGRFIVVGGLPEGVEENYAYEYDEDFNFVKKHIINSGYTRLGIQTAAFADGQWWFGCYGNKLLKTDASFNLLGKYDFNCGVGIVGVSDTTFLIGRGPCSEESGCTGKALVATAENELGLVIKPDQVMSFKLQDDILQISSGGKSFAEYVCQDEQIQRPYFRHVYSPSGIQVTRNHPPVMRQDLDDHPTMHPGLWLAFGDINGADFWRNKGRVLGYDDLARIRIRKSLSTEWVGKQKTVITSVKP